MCYIRGVPRDYDEWARVAGDERWDWHNVLPYFRRAEGNTRGADDVARRRRPARACRTCVTQPLSQAFVDAATPAAIRATTTSTARSSKASACTR